MVNILLFTLLEKTIKSYSTVNTFSETQGQLVGAAKSLKLNRREKNLGKEKSRTRRRAHGDKVLMDQFQTVRLVLASDWCQKTIVFFCPITELQDYEPFHVFLHDTYIQVSCSPYVVTRGEKFQSQHKIWQNVGEIVRHIRKKLAANTLDLSQVS